MLDRRRFLAATAVASVGAAEAVRKPNVVYMLAGNWRAQALPSAGDGNVIAPNLAKMAAEGLHFSRSYTANPDSAAAHAALFTGKFPHAVKVVREGMLLPSDEVTILQALANGGYRTSGPDLPVEQALGFIEQNRDVPFYASVALGTLQAPYLAPRQYVNQYSLASISLRDNVPSANDSAARKMALGFYALCSALDAGVGRILKKLEELKLAEDTIVVFTSDVGQLLGSHGADAEGVPYEELVGVPLLMRYPRRLKRGVQDDLLVSSVDHLPTLLGLCGVNLPDGVQGRNLSKLLTGADGDRPDSIYCEGQLGTSAEWRMIVRGLDKMVIGRDLHVTHLFNLGIDSLERDNLAKNNAYVRLRDALMAAMKRWMVLTGDRVPYPLERRR